jgi:hypothetical protein
VKKSDLSKVLKFVSDPAKRKATQEILSAFQDIVKHERGKKKLKSAKKLLKEI